MAPNRLDDFFRKTIEKSAAHYCEKAPRSKEDIWAEVMNDSGSVSVNWKRLLLAASVILLLIISSFQYYSLKEKNSLIMLMSKQITQMEKENNKAQMVLQNRQQEAYVNTIIDTVVIEKIVPVTETITLVEYITDTIYKIPENKIHEIDQLARIEDMEKTDNRLPVTKTEKENHVVEFTLPENKEPGTEKKSLENLLMDFAKNKAPKQSGSSANTLQASIKQFLSMN